MYRYFSIVSSMPETISSISCIFLVKFAPIVPVAFLKFFYFQISLSLCFHFAFIFISRLETFYSIPSTVFFLDFKGFINFLQFLFWFCCLFKDLYNLHIVGFKIFFSCFICAEIFRVCCGKIAGLWWRLIVLAVINHVLIFNSSEFSLFCPNTLCFEPYLRAWST